jgi:hypothetical protein
VSYTAALIGGPRAGEVVMVRDRGPLRTMLPPEDLGYVREIDLWRSEPVVPRELTYEPRTLSFFGAPLYVWCAPEFMGDENRIEFASQVGAHILSPLGKSLLMEGLQ